MLYQITMEGSKEWQIKAVSYTHLSMAVRKKIPLLKDVAAEEFWVKVDVLTMECIRGDIRDLVNYLVIYDEEKVAFFNPTKRKSKSKSKVFL